MSGRSAAEASYAITALIKRTESISLPGLPAEAVLCEFDSAAFSDEDFSRLAIPRPAQLGRANARRCAEFLAGRLAAREAARKLAIPLPAVPIGRDRSPRWPRGVCGSISHSGNLALAAVSDSCAGIGVDIEQGLTGMQVDELRGLVLSLPEQQLLARQFEDVVTAFTIAFSAKESCYKAIYPLAGKRFSFEDVELVELDRAGQQLRLALGKKARLGSVTELSLCWQERDGAVISYAQL